jgi:hypothetical protein
MGLSNQGLAVGAPGRRRGCNKRPAKSLQEQQQHHQQEHALTQAWLFQLQKQPLGWLQRRHQVGYHWPSAGSGITGSLLLPSWQGRGCRQKAQPVTQSGETRICP